MLIRFRNVLLSVFVFSILPTNFLLAQSGSSSSLFNNGLLIVAAVVILMAVYLVSENLLGIEAKHLGRNELDSNSSSSLLSWLGRVKPPSFAQGHFVKLKRGHNIKLVGGAKDEIEEVEVKTFAVQPPNFEGISPIPKVVVDEGDVVVAGQELFFDKKRPDIKYTSPVSGEVVAINRGAKRSISEVVILADKEQKCKRFEAIDLDRISREELVAFLLESGAWPMIRQRPYDIVADPKEVPENIFISTFDTAPLAPDYDLIIKGNESAFSAGIKALRRLTEGAVHLGLDGNRKKSPSCFPDVEGAEKHWFAGPHPAGNVGVQIHHIQPIKAKSHVWVVGVQEAITIGKLFTEQRFDSTRVVCLAGESLNDARHVRTQLGANLGDLLAGENLGESDRIISGDVLSGKTKHLNGFLNFYDDQVTAIPEGKEFRFLGWLIPSKLKPSVSRTYPGFLLKDMKYKVNTNTNGEERAFVVTGQYEKLLPMDIYPQHLMKAILAKDFERMEGLGIYELSEEDVALCEFACTSKQPLQHILRSGLNLMREQG